MMALVEIPSPLRPLAAQVLATIYPLFAPASLRRTVSAACERERRLLRGLTNGWTERHWQALSAALSRSGHPVQLRNIDEAISHTAIPIAIEGAIFQVCWPKDATEPCACGGTGWRGVSLADMGAQIKQVAIEIARQEALERRHQAMRNLVISEQQRSRAAATAVQADIEAWRKRLADVTKTVAVYMKTSREIANARLGAERSLASATAAAREMAARGRAALAALALLQDERDSCLAPATAGRTVELERLLAIETAIDRRLAEIKTLEIEANQQTEAIKLIETAIGQLDDRHARTAQAPFDAAVAEADRMAKAWQARLAELADPSLAALLCFRFHRYWAPIPEVSGSPKHRCIVPDSSRRAGAPLTPPPPTAFRRGGTTLGPGGPVVGGMVRPEAGAVGGPATQPYSTTEVDGWLPPWLDLRRPGASTRRGDRG